MHKVNPTGNTRIKESRRKTTSFDLGIFVLGNPGLDAKLQYTRSGMLEKENQFVASSRY